MASRGETTGEGPRACPFVALEHDRDQRADRPDYRHRCYAEPTPAPRAIAHQEAFCLSPNFAGCPVFQDWAARAAAREVPVVEAEQQPLPGVAAAAVPLAAAAAPDDDAALPDEHERYRPPQAAAADEPPAAAGDEPQAAAADAPQAAAADAPSAAAADAPSAEPRQLGAFDGGSTPEPSEQASARSPADDWAAEDEAEESSAEHEPAPPPPFLAGRPPRDPIAPPADSPASPAQPSASDRAQYYERVKREDLVPSWDIDGRYGAQASESAPSDRFGNMLTIIAVVAILAMGVAGVIFLPGILAGGGPSRTATPSLAAPTTLLSPAPSVSASAEPTDEATDEPTAAPPTPSPAPEVSPVTYRIRAGDNLRRIARRFDTTVQEILAANPQIENPNHIQVGQVITIPVAAPE